MNCIYLISTDIRFDDNHTLLKCVKTSKNLAFVYCVPQNISKQRWLFIHESLSEFSSKIQQAGHELHIIESLEELEAVPDVDMIYYSKKYLKDLSFKNFEDKDKNKRITVKSIENGTLYNLEQLPTSLEDLPKVFTSFRKKVEKSNAIIKEPLKAITPEELKKVEKLNLNFKKFDDLIKPKPMSRSYFKGGETEALKRLDYYFSKPNLPKNYKETRNGMIHFDDSTKFSPWLAQGCLSPKRVYSDLKKFEATHGTNESTYWIWFELLWRDFFKFTCLKHGHDLKQLNGLQDHYEVKKEGEEALKTFENWKIGNTGQNFIDANMIELLNHGWMSNRGRQNVASFFCHHLGLDWRWGARWFEHQLIDYDEESNWGNWSYQAGVGNDPRDRVFNPNRQAEIYDKQGLYRNKFLKTNKEN